MSNNILDDKATIHLNESEQQELLAAFHKTKGTVNFTRKILLYFGVVILFAALGLYFTEENSLDNNSLLLKFFFLGTGLLTLGFLARFFPIIVFLTSFVLGGALILYLEAYSSLLDLITTFGSLGVFGWSSFNAFRNKQFLDKIKRANILEKINVDD